MDQANSQFDFLKDFIEQLFDDSGFAGISEDARKQFVPQFTAEAERRIGLALMPMLNEKQSEELIAIVEDRGADNEALSDFWHRAIPNFDAVVEETLRNFANEFKSLVGNA